MRGCTLLFSARAVIIPKYTRLSVFLCDSLSFLLFYTPSMLSVCRVLPSRVVFYSHLSLCFIVSLLPVLLLSPSTSLTHPVCIIQAKIPACQAWPLNIHGDAAPGPFSAAVLQRRSTTEGWRGAPWMVTWRCESL